MLRSAFRALFLVFALSSLGLRADIVEVEHFSEIHHFLTKDCLVILDIDDTLLIPKQMLGCDLWFQARLNKHQKSGFNFKRSLDKALAEWEAVRHLTEMEIVEPGSELIVEELQKHYAVMGLTTQGLALAARTKQQLLDVAIDLSLSAPSQEDHYQITQNEGVLFRHGALFTAGTHKGKALFQFLDHLNYTPSAIVFLNDKATHLRSIEETAQERGIPFVGLRYAYSDARKSEYNSHVADYQFTHSTFTHILSDAEAEVALLCESNN